MGQLLSLLEGKKTYLGAAIVALATMLGTMGALTPEWQSTLLQLGAAIGLVGLRAALGKIHVSIQGDKEDGAKSANNFRIFPGGPAVLLALGISLWSTAPVHAQQVQKTCLFGCRCGGSQQQKTDPQVLALLQQIAANQHQQSPQTDPAVMALLNQLVSQNGQILTLLQGQQANPPSARNAPTPAPSGPAAPSGPFVFLMPQSGGPQQQIPLGGPALQQIPLGGPALQQIPLGGPPMQQIPLGGPPLQQVPLGGPPQQQIPLGGQPQQQIQQGTPPKQQMPAIPQGAQPQQQVPLGNIPQFIQPVGYQRYTTVAAEWRPAKR